MNLPNKLTSARFLLAVLFVGVMSSQWAFSHAVALLLFLVASLTDWLDGYLARRWKLVTDFGRLMDPLADKILTASALICLVAQRTPTLGEGIPPWVVVTIIAREFAITGLRLLAATKGQVLSAEKLGKHKMVWQILTIIYFLLLLSYAEFVQANLVPGVSWVGLAWVYGGWFFISVTLVLTVYSGIGYLWRHRELFMETR